MEVAGKQVHIKMPESESKLIPIKLSGGEKYLKIVYLNTQANGPGWIARVDIPGTLSPWLDGMASFLTCSTKAVAGLRDDVCIWG